MEITEKMIKYEMSMIFYRDLYRKHIIENLKDNISYQDTLALYRDCANNLLEALRTIDKQPETASQFEGKTLMLTCIMKLMRTLADFESAELIRVIRTEERSGKFLLDSGKKDVTRIKKLLEMKHRASLMPKTKLAEFEEEYADLLERIEFERKRLGIDEKSIQMLKDTVALEYGGQTARERMSKETASLIRAEEKAIDKAARFADLDDLEYHKGRLTELWRQEHTQISMREEKECEVYDETRFF